MPAPRQGDAGVGALDVAPALVVHVAIQRMVRRKEIEELLAPAIRRIPIAGREVVSGEQTSLRRGAEHDAPLRGEGMGGEVVPSPLAALPDRLRIEVEAAETIAGARPQRVDGGRAEGSRTLPRRR